MFANGKVAGVRRTGLGLIAAIMALFVVTGAQAAHDGQAHDHAPGQVLRVLALFPMTGPGASLGAFLEQGAALAAEQVAERHGGALQVELQVIDSKGKAAEAVTALQAALVRQRPHAIITSLSPVSRAIKPIVEKEGILTLVTMTTMEDIARGTKHMARLYATAADFTDPLAAHTIKNHRKVHVLYLHDEFGQSMYEAYAAALHGSETVLTASTYEMMQKDTRTLVSRIVDEQPDAVYVVGYGPAYLASIRQLRELAPALPLLADSTFSDPANRAALGDFAEGVIFTGSENELATPVLPSAITFRQLFGKRYGRLPYAPAVFTFDAVTLLADVAWRKNKVVAPGKKEVLKKSPVNGVLGQIHIDRQGESRFAMMLLKVENGDNVAAP